MTGPDWMVGASRPITKVLVANRGEIACRVFRACAELGISSVAVFSEADRGSMHMQMADEAVFLEGTELSETYLNIRAIIEAAESTGSDAIHPGYGFLSERSAFAEAVLSANLVWIGPPSHAIDEMGDKVRARRAMIEANVPVIPGEELPLDNPEDLVEELVRAATRVGYPLLLKASAGGGGKGMRVVREPRNLQREYAAASREATTAFGDGTVYVERLLEKSRHIEVQVLADSHGNVVHLFERECSIQRRHQKVVEEAPSPVLTPENRLAMGAAAVNAAKAVNYEGAGTVEFLMAEDGEFHFLEMNTRLQVEHPVTESISGVDLVVEQLRVAAGLPLEFTQDDLTIRGHAIEVRIYAEDPANNFLPATGPLVMFRPPEGPGIRLDTGVREGDEARIDFDPMLAKLIVHAPDRPSAIRRMKRACEDFIILGATTNLGFLTDIMNHDAYLSGATTTDFIDIHWPEGWVSTPPSDAVFAAAAAEHMGLARKAIAVEADEGRGSPYNPFLSLRRSFP
ncbi:MAG: acetyl-CoA carboxylase biotin carboxylase subunit [Candidatus Thalassarchaeaceae archaeon]|jgi:acetyl-CoA carboxylase biotin carboxylase subunit|nr:acetyl-CoA carboxylase biotin carboxylase subunit [Candidatus Thalassarchaeaceae archaeon]